MSSTSSMMPGRTRVGWALAALGVASLLALAGCGGGDNSLRVRPPVERPDEPTAVGGTLFTLSGRMIDQAYNAEIELTGTPDNPATPGPITRATRSTIRGGYQFANLPAGVYSVRASVRSTREPFLTLAGEVHGVHARGNIPSLMVNLLLGEDANMATFRGAITQNGLPASAAVVSADVTAYTTDYLQGNTTDTVSVIISTNADAGGLYEMRVPAGGLRYYVGAHTDTSMVGNSAEMTDVAAGEERVVDLDLVNAEAPVFSDLVVDLVSTTLPDLSAQASQQAMITRLAVARARRAPADRMRRLEQMAGARSATRSNGSIVENDLYWFLTSPEGDVGVRGFHVYRSDRIQGPFTLVGSARDPYQLFFFDNDPALAPELSTYYVVTSYAANDRTSPPSLVVTARPLPQITLVGPADGESVPQSTARITWQPALNALSYMVLIYDDEPAFNMAPRVVYGDLPASATSAPISALPPGDYWWSVSAYNTEDANFATAASFTRYRRVIIAP